MQIRSLLLLAAATFSASISAQAVITNVTGADDGDGAVVCPGYSWGAVTSIEIYGDQYWGPGHIRGDITTDTPQDPILTIFNSIDNDTAFSWGSYQVNVTMNKTFGLSGASITAPAGWSFSVSTPVQVSATEWTGTILYSGGTPIDPLGTIDFGFQMSFAGSAHWSEELIPIAVPEPGSFALLMVGGLAMASRKSLFRR